MKLWSIRLGFRTIAFALVGSALLLLGLSTRGGASIRQAIMQRASALNCAHGTFALSSCESNSKNESDEIFFLSCGGIY
jgi:hypothetical protein